MREDKEVAEDIEVEDSDSYISGSKNVEYKTIVMRQFQKCCDECSKELTKGGIVKRFIHGEIQEYIVPDQSQVIINSIEALKIILQPKIDKNKDTVKPYFDAFSEKLKDLKEIRNKRLKAINTSNIYNAPNRVNLIMQRNDEIHNTNESYEVDLVRLYKEKLLVGISILLGKLNYFEEFSYQA